MAKASKRNPNTKTLTTPRGTLKYPFLTEPWFGTEKHPSKEGMYITQIILDTSDPKVKTFLATIDELMEVSKAEAEKKLSEFSIETRKGIEKKGGIKPRLPYTELYDAETEEPTGEVEMKIKKMYSGVSKRTGKEWKAPRPPLFDSACPPQLLHKDAQIWGGSVATINADFTPYFMNSSAEYGVSCRLNAVQIFELVSGNGSRSASSYGFEGSEDGFDGSTMIFERESDETSETSSEEHETDF